VVLFGASGTMGWKAFLELWRGRDRYDIVVLARPSEKNRRLFAPYVREAGVPAAVRKGLAEGHGLTVVWGDATDPNDVGLAVAGADWVLDAMAYISPQADYHPEMARAVNTEAIRNIVRAVEAQPGGAERTRLLYTGTVAETGDRLPPIHWGRVGDPLKPSIFDYYAATKIAGERSVLESNIRHWASLRMTYIMPTTYRELVALQDPIAFHMPLNAYMENVTDRDAGYGLVNCLNIPDESDFWRRAYNMGGGPQMRCVAYDFAGMNYKLNGLSGLEACTERRWYALRNFHMQWYEDSGLLNDYLHHWRDSLDEYWKLIARDMPLGMKALAAACRRIAPLRAQVEKVTREMMRRMAEEHRNGTAYWHRNRNDLRITAFFKDYATYESIPGWGVNMPQFDPGPERLRLDHGYDETKGQLELPDLQGAARFRGGECLSREWDSDLYTALRWKCACGHEFDARPYTVLKAGHWCPNCVPPPWDFDAEARRNPFFAQVWYPNHDPAEHNFYPEDCTQDIVCADENTKK
jgi:nucleoside-diphosphate-sugar epimerase